VLHGDGAEAQHGVEGDDVLRTVRQHDRDRVSRANAQIAQSGGGTIDRALHRGVRRLLPEELQGDSIRIVARGCCDDVDQRAVDRGEIFRNTLGVAGDPGARGIERRHGDSILRQLGRRARASVSTARTRLGSCLKSPLSSCAISACSRASS
jgi:hypothetical protein